MKNAVVAAVVAALVSSGATLAATRISGQAILKHSIPANRLTAKAVKSLRSTPDPRQLAASVNSTLNQVANSVAITANPQTVTAVCPAGDMAVGGGYNLSANFGVITGDGITADSSGWAVSIAGAYGPAVDQVVTLTVNVSCEPSG